MNALAAGLLRALDAMEWFAGLPDELARSQRASVLDHAGLTPWEGLAAVHVDAEYLFDDRPYVALLEMFGRGSCGAFRPERIEQGARGSVAAVSFAVGSRRYSMELPMEADEPPASFFETVDRALAESGGPLRFARLLDLRHSPIPAYVLGTPAGLARLAASGLAPVSLPAGVSDPEDPKRWRALAWGASRGTQRIQLTAGRQPIAWMEVPGYLSRSSLEIKGGENLLFDYGMEGLASVRCGRPLPMADYVKAHAASVDVDYGLRPTVTMARKPQVTRAGTRHDGELRWRRREGELRFAFRCDEIEDGAVQLFYCAPKDISSCFAAAFETFHLAERTPALDKLLKSFARRSGRRLIARADAP
jgi:hypothetical protein